MNDFDLAAYDFDLPEFLIAQSPLVPRDSSRLMVVDRSTRSWRHSTFRELPKILREGDCLVANNSRVIKARLLGHRLRPEHPHRSPHGAAGPWVPGGRVEFVLLEELEPRVWEGLFHASAKYQPGLRFEVPTPDGHGLRGELIRGVADSAFGTVVARFDRDPVEADAGQIPLPPYIERDAHDEDSIAYQTVYSKSNGSAAAPTAGLHFTDRVMNDLRAASIDWNEVTLHVGLGTFRPVKEADIRQHRMHQERFEISTETAHRITDAFRARRRIIAVGTTSVRTLEGAWDSEHRILRAGAGRTDIFIHPGGRLPQFVSGLLTNFHLPKSSLIMLVSAFADRQLILDAYREAVRERYRFFSYGDAMLIV